MKIHFECQECGKEPSAASQALIGAAFEALLSGGQLPEKGETVVECTARVLVSLLDVYVRPMNDSTASEHVRGLQQELAALLSALKKPQDEVVKSFGVVNRQALWSVLSMLEKERTRGLEASNQPNQA